MTDKLILPDDGWLWLTVVTKPVRDQVQAIRKLPASLPEDSEEFCYICVYVDNHIGNDILTSFDMPAKMFGRMEYYYPYKYDDFTYQGMSSVEIINDNIVRFGENERE